MGLPDIDNIPDTGAIFTLGRSRFADNIPSHFFIRNDPVISITCGDEHSAVVCQSGRLFVFGSNDWGQLGLGHKNHVSKPSCVKILKPQKVTHVACGRAHTLICTGEQKIFACGSDQESQLGRGQMSLGECSSSPVPIYDCGIAGPKILQVAAGSHHSLALTSDGEVLAWGSNLEGQLGLPGTSGLVNIPTKVQLPEPVKQISAGYYHSAFLTESGAVYVCGEAESGKLGITLDFRTQVAPKPMQLSTTAVFVACGGHHTLILGDDGNLYCTGSNASGQLGMGTNVTEIQTPKQLSRGVLENEVIAKIECGESHIAVVTESGKLFTCGDGRHGKLGLEENENNVHELTYASKYQELFVTNVACGGCHTILVGRRRNGENDNEEAKQMKNNSLPPLKIPTCIQNDSPTKLENVDNGSEAEKGENEPSEKDIDSAENKTNGIEATLENENNKTENTEENKSNENDNSVENKPNENNNPLENKITDDKTLIENNTNGVGESEKHENSVEKPESPKKPTEYDSSTQIKDKDNDVENVVNEEKNRNNDERVANLTNEANNQDDKSITENNERPKSSKSHGDSVAVEESKKKEETINNEEITVEKPASPPLPVPPPKPPRQKINSAGSQVSSNAPSSASSKGGSEKAVNIDTQIKMKSPSKNSVHPKEDEEVKSMNGSERKSASSQKSQSIKSKADTDETVTLEAKIVDSLEKVDHFERKVVKTIDEKIDMIADDADVIQSPVRGTAKITKLFKSKKQEIENGTKEAVSASANTKGKSKTCNIL
ncbi:X-linked retinitis pigmentosa GTPase regulator [Chelonus insularis]|uniref:X-linked retinitis pigmentosa GTPase regulator n=1 Tax=Chelonus insularis TaxID=460826 RepID=UPI00158C8EE1|nr:X-linked retinitis pigmentosa GTPase regulator [Chelonus insularis]